MCMLILRNVKCAASLPWQASLLCPRQTVLSCLHCCRVRPSTPPCFALPCLLCCAGLKLAAHTPALHFVLPLLQPRPRRRWRGCGSSCSSSKGGPAPWLLKRTRRSASWPPGRWVDGRASGWAVGAWYGWMGERSGGLMMHVGLLGGWADECQGWARTCGVLSRV